MIKNEFLSKNQRAGGESSKPVQWKIYSLAFTVYTLWFVLQIPQVYLYNLQSKQPVPWWFSIYRLALATYIWAFLTPFIFKLGRRFPIGYQHLWRNLILHLFFGFTCGLVQTVAYHIGVALVNGDSIFPALVPIVNPAYFLNFLSLSLFHYTAVSAIYQAYLHFKESQDRKFRLQQAELQTLKTQLHPHFLFNTLNAVSSLVASSPKAAQTTIAQLSDLLRLSLKDNRTQEIPLKDELDFLRKYVQIQQILLQERLEVVWNIAPDTLDALVPNLILQPLVENAIRHGIAPKETGGLITINTARKNDALVFVLSDDGLGLSPGNSNQGNGIGLNNTRTRLQHLYGDAHEFALSEPAEGGVTIRIKLPFRENAEKY